MRLRGWLARLRLLRPNELRAICGADHRVGDVRPGAQCPCGIARVVQLASGCLAVSVDQLPAGHAVSWEHTVTWGVESGPSLSPEHIDTLLDLARAGREGDFRDLAAMVGVAPGEIDGLWSGTVKRLRV